MKLQFEAYQFDPYEWDKKWYTDTSWKDLQRAMIVEDFYNQLYDRQRQYIMQLHNMQLQCQSDIQNLRQDEMDRLYQLEAS